MEKSGRDTLSGVMGKPVHFTKAVIVAGSLRFSFATSAANSAWVETQGLNCEKSVGGLQSVNAPHPVKVGGMLTYVVF